MAAEPQEAPPHAGQVVRCVLLRPNIAVDVETAQLVAAAVQAAVTLGDPPEQSVISLATKSTGLGAHAAGLARGEYPVPGKIPWRSLDEEKDRPGSRRSD
jgi:hypothetical protein